MSILPLPERCETLTLETPAPHVLTVRLDRPDAGNALNTQMGAELKQVWDSLYVDQGDIRCVILTGAGQKIFCAGGDLKQRNNMTDAQWQQQHALFELMMIAMMNCPVPIIAAVNGAAFGGGCEFVAASDFAYASENARFALTETTLGIMPGAMGTQNLPRAVGDRRAKEIILTGAPFTSAEALAWGLVNKVVPIADLMTVTLETASRIAANAPISIRQAKKSISMASQTDLHIGYRYEVEAYNRMVPTEDRLEGVRAFNEKRKPDFRGR
ncbi:MAG: enoyl-CoA hydratase-related protein [Pseudomonadales bacterium]